MNKLLLLTCPVQTSVNDTVELSPAADAFFLVNVAPFKGQTGFPTVSDL